MKYYAGIGSRETPQHILELMTNIAKVMDNKGYILRSGGANGADSAFSNGATNKQIFIPWDGFNNIQSEFVGASKRAFQMARMIHPNFGACSNGAKKLHARNIHQVMGWEMKPESYCTAVICWTEDGAEIGGTATAIKLAKLLGITVHNLGLESVEKKFIEWCNNAS